MFYADERKGCGPSYGVLRVEHLGFKVLNGRASCRLMFVLNNAATGGTPPSFHGYSGAPAPRPRDAKAMVRSRRPRSPRMLVGFIGTSHRLQLFKLLLFRCSLDFK